MIAVVSLFDSESSNWGCWLSPFVIKGPLPYIQVHLRFDSVGGNQDDLMEKEVEFIPLPKLIGCEGGLSTGKLLAVSSDPGLVELELVETKELARVWGTVCVTGSIYVSTRSGVLFGMETSGS